MSEFLAPPNRCTCPPKPCRACRQAGEKAIAHPRGRKPQSPTQRLAAYRRELIHDRKRCAEIAQALQRPMQATARQALEAERMVVQRSINRKQSWVDDLVRAGKAKEQK